MISNPWLVIIPSGMVGMSLIVTMAAYYNERSSPRESPLKLAGLLMLFIMGSWSLLTVLVLAVGYGVWRLAF